MYFFKISMFIIEQIFICLEGMLGKIRSGLSFLKGSRIRIVSFSFFFKQIL